MLACRISGGAMLAPSLLQELWTNQRSVAAEDIVQERGIRSGDLSILQRTMKRVGETMARFSGL
jgi:cell division protein FtsI/penicillin-binding protein 2